MNTAARRSACHPMSENPYKSPDVPAELRHRRRRDHVRMWLGIAMVVLGSPFLFMAIVAFAFMAIGLRPTDMEIVTVSLIISGIGLFSVGYGLILATGRNKPGTSSNDWQPIKHEP